MNKLYAINASRRDGAELGFNFDIREVGYKQAWIEARRLCRVGGVVTSCGDDVDMPAGVFTVRSVFLHESEQKQKAKVITAEQLFEACETQGITVKKAILEVYATLGGVLSEASEAEGDTTEEVPADEAAA